MYLKSLCHDFINAVTKMYAKDRVSLHEPIFVGKEKELLNQAIEVLCLVSRKASDRF